MLESDAAAPTVLIIDDDESVRQALEFLLKSLGFVYLSYASAKAFTEQYAGDIPGCIISDIRMPGMSGLELQRWLQAAGSRMPIIFISGHGDIPMAVETIKNGAVDFLTKPFRDQELLDCINAALKIDSKLRRELEQSSIVQQRLASLSKREKEVLDRVVAGESNKVIAMALGLSHRTIEVHRAHVMEKMQVKSLPALLKSLQF